MATTSASKLLPGQTVQAAAWAEKGPAVVESVERVGTRRVVTFTDGYVERCSPNTKFTVIR